MKHDDEERITAGYIGTDIPVDHAAFEHHYVVINPVSTLTLAEIFSSVIFSDGWDEGNSALFFDGTKIGGQDIARRDDRTNFLFDDKGKKLGFCSDLGIAQIPPQGFHKISLISADKDITTADDMPLRTRVSIRLSDNERYKIAESSPGQTLAKRLEC